jgi:Protein affecting phage T7 exclusion by the F plasmid
MMARLFLLFTVVPLLELYILIKIGGYIGAFPTVGLVVLTALLGFVLARFEGLRKLQQIKRSLSLGIVPAEEMLDGVLIFVGGVLLIIPGVLTDLFALILLIPYTRTIFKRWLRRRFDRMIATGNVRLHYYGRS